MSTGQDIGLPGHLRRETGLPFERVDRAEHALAAATLAAAFRDDPVCSWLFPDPATRHRDLLEFFTTTLGWTAAHGGLVMASPGHGCVYAAYLPGGDPSEVDVLRLPALRPRAGLVEELGVLADRRRRALPPHLYATYCGVRPGSRGLGLFRSALAAVAAWCDDTGTAFYAEATSADGAALYERAGFPRLGAPLVAPGAPALHPVWRACADPTP